MTGQTALRTLAMLAAAAAPALPDTKVATEYTAGGQTVETTIYAKGSRLRYEYGEGLTLIRNCAEKRLVQIDDKSKTYMTLPGEAPAGAPDAASQPQVTPTGETKSMFGQTARHLKVTTAAAGNSGRTETDGWYLDGTELACAAQGTAAPGSAFPASYTSTAYGEDGKVSSSFTMRIKSFENGPLDPALFEIPAGYTASGPPSADEKKSRKTDGVVRIGVVALRGKAAPPMLADGAYQRLIARLTEAKFDAVPLADGTPDAIAHEAKNWQCDYVLFNEAAGPEQEKALSGGRKIGGFLRHAPVIGHVAGGEASEARLDYRLVPAAGGAPVLASSANGKAGGSFNWKAAASLASNMVPMVMVAKMAGGSAMLNPAMMHTLMAGKTGGLPMAGFDPMMSGMSMYLGALNPGMAGKSSASSMAGTASMVGGMSVASTALSTGLAGRAGGLNPMTSGLSLISGSTKPGMGMTGPVANPVVAQALTAAVDQEVAAIAAQLKPASK